MQPGSLLVGFAVTTLYFYSNSGDSNAHHKTIAALKSTTCSPSTSFVPNYELPCFTVRILVYLMYIPYMNMCCTSFTPLSYMNIYSDTQKERKKYKATQHKHSATQDL